MKRKILSIIKQGGMPSCYAALALAFLLAVALPSPVRAASTPTTIDLALIDSNTLAGVLSATSINVGGRRHAGHRRRLHADVHRRDHCQRRDADHAKRRSGQRRQRDDRFR